MTNVPLSWVFEANRPQVLKGHRMQLQQSGFSSSSSTSCQSAACKLLLGSVWSALGRTGQAGGVKDIAAALTPQLTRTLGNALGNALDRVSQQLESQGVNPTHVQTLVGLFNQELSAALNMAHRP
jgi:hypothetical protein